MVYAMQFSLEHCKDPQDHKSEEEYKAITVKGAIWPNTKDWLVQPCKMKEYHLNIKTVAALIHHNASTSLNMWKYVS